MSRRILNGSILGKVCPTGGNPNLISALVLYLLAVAVSPAQTFTTLANFDGANGNGPTGVLIQGSDGGFYGMAGGGANDTCYFLIALYDCGTIFKVTTGGELSTLHSFDGTDGENFTYNWYPAAGLVHATDGNFYGTTFDGGSFDYGTIFKITPDGTLTTLYDFCMQPDCTDGLSPGGGLVEASDGNFYGTTESGGTNFFGNVFKMTPAGVVTTIYSFCAQASCPDGSGPYGALVQATDGELYGTTISGGANSWGTVFKITLGGTLTTLHSFNFSDGYGPIAGLVQATDGSLYGTTSFGGVNGSGTVFKITPGGTLTTVYNFNGNDGGELTGGLVLSTDGNFYGTTQFGGPTSGTIFKLTPGGAMTTLHSFNFSDGAYPAAGLVQGTDGNFYGTTSSGGANTDCTGSFYGPGCGTVFSLSVGLRPFVITVPTSGAVGATVSILGNDLTSATSVSFDGVSAVFEITSRTMISATVPTGATTGFVKVSGPDHTLKSNVKFQVQP